MNEIVNLEGEIWKPVVGYEGKYEVSNKGRVKSLRYGRWGDSPAILSIATDKYGYSVVSLNDKVRRKNFFVHRLVFNAFIGGLPEFDFSAKGDDRLEINHKNEIKNDNRIENLELITCKENNNYGTHTKRAIKNRNKYVYQYTLDGVLLKIWNNPTDCKKGGFGPSKVGLCCRNKYNHPHPNIYKGFIWSYIPLTQHGRADSNI